MSDIATRPDRSHRRRRSHAQPQPPSSPEISATSSAPPPTSTPRGSPGKTRRASTAHPLAPGDDRTDPELLALSEEEFGREVERRLGLGMASEAEEAATGEVLLPRPKNKAEELALHMRVMDSLRERVLALEKEDDPEFDPLCPPSEDTEGLRDDPLRLLALSKGGEGILRGSEVKMPEKL